MTTPSDIRQALDFLVPLVGRYWHRPVQAYSCALYESFELDNTEVRRDAFRRLCQLLRVRAAGLGYCETEIRQLMETIRRRPVIQTGPHCHLIIEPDAFYTHLFGLMALNAYSENWYINYSVSTVKFTEKAKKGPGWLWLDGQPVNVFGLSRSKMEPYSICGHNASYRFALKPNNSQIDHPALDRLAAILPSQEYGSAAEAIKSANEYLWRHCFGTGIRFLQLDETDISSLVVDHLKDSSSWLSRNFISDRGMVSSFLHAARELDLGPWAGWFKLNTDFFWLLRDGRLRRLRLKGDALCDEAGTYKVAFNSRSLADSLEAGEVVPGLFLVFLTLTILPGLRALGGSRQVVYYPLMRQLLLSALDQSPDPVNRSLAKAIRTDPVPSGWGHRTVAPLCEDPWRLFTADEPASISSLVQQLGSQTLKETSGQLPGFTGDQLWCQSLRKFWKGHPDRRSNDTFR